MRWYQDFKSITLSGELKDEIKEKLILLAADLSYRTSKKF